MDLRPPFAMPEGLFVPRCQPITETVTLRPFLLAASRLGHGRLFLRAFRSVRSEAPSARESDPKERSIFPPPVAIVSAVCDRSATTFRAASQETAHKGRRCRREARGFSGPSIWPVLSRPGSGHHRQGDSSADSRSIAIRLVGRAFARDGRRASRPRRDDK